jgi:hypothetical protein
MIMNGGKVNWKEGFMAQLKVIWHMPGHAKQNHEKPQNSW